MIGTCFENGRNVSLLSSHLSPSPPHMSAAQETPNRRNKLFFYLSDRILHDEHIGDVAELAEVLAQLVLAGLPTEAPTKSLPGAESEEGVDRPEDSPWLPSSLVPEVGEVRGNPVSAAWSIDNLGRQRVRS